MPTGMVDIEFACLPVSPLAGLTAWYLSQPASRRGGLAAAFFKLFIHLVFVSPGTMSLKNLK